MSAPNPVNILLVEDNPDHAELTRRAFDNGHLVNPVFWVKDGAEALDFLHQRGPYSDRARAPRAGLIVLDLNLPKVSGLEVLRHIKSDAGLRMTPVIVLTTSSREEELLASYEAGVNSYVTKPVRFADFMERVRALQLYWVLTNACPALGG